VFIISIEPQTLFMKRIILCTLFFTLTSLLFAQIDYSKIKDSVCPGKNFCGFRDSADLAMIYPMMMSLDTTKITNGIAEYYHDLWEVEYELYARRHADTVFLRRCVNSAIRGLYHDPKNYSMAWDAALGYARFKECDKALYYMNIYAETCPRRYWDKQQNGYFLYSCPSEELRKKFHLSKKKLAKLCQEFK